MSAFRTFVLAKTVDARPMTRGEYNRYRGWLTPSNENDGDEGYLCVFAGCGKANDKRHDAPIGWLAKDFFDGKYKADSQN